MPQLFVANVTKQTHILSYRRSGFDKLLEERIAPGHQVMIELENKAELDAIVAQHRRYGLVEWTDVPKTQRFSGQCYRFDSPVPIQALEEGVQRRDDAVDQRSQAVLETTTAAVQNEAENIAERVGLAGAKIEVEFEETRPRGTRNNAAPVKQKLVTGRNDDKAQKARHSGATAR